MFEMCSGINPTTLFLGVGYAFCSSMMLVFNKLAIDAFGFSSTLMALQFAFSAGAVKLLAMTGQLECDPLEWSKAKTFWLVPFSFFLAIFTNIKVLAVANVEIVIIFRTTVTVVTSVCDFWFLGRELPSQRSQGSLITIIAGALLFSWGSGGDISVLTYVWAFLYVAVLSFETVYVKHIFNTCEMGTWTRVYYNNVIAMCMCPAFLLVGSEYEALYQGWVGLNDVSFGSMQRMLLWVGMSCFVGLAISYFGFGFRSVVTATTFTVLGLLNKIGTLLVSALVWSPDLSVFKVVALLMCLGGGAFYQQAPPRDAPTEGQHDVDLEKVTLVDQEGANSIGEAAQHGAFAKPVDS